MMIDYCDSMRQWLSTKSSLALIHSKAGKGRSSMMAAAYLLDSGVASTADAALRLFWTRRPDLENESSMTPSQTRYVHYCKACCDTMRSPALTWCTIMNR